MIWRLCSVYDKGAAVWLPPFCVRSAGEAVRMFQQSCRDSKTMMAQYPEQFALYEIGMFDDVTGEASASLQAHVLLSVATGEVAT